MSDTVPGPKKMLLDIPSEVVLEYLLPVLSLKDLTSLSAVNRHYYALCNDEALWLHLTLQTFHLSPHTLAPPAPSSGWSKRVYAGLLRPRTFVWGSADNGRLGLPRPAPGQARILVHTRYVRTPREITEQFRPGGREWKAVLRDSLAKAVGRGGGEAEVLDGAKEAQRMAGGVGVVEMQAGGWSFTARDMEGGVWVWGQLDGSLIAFRAESWENKHCQVPEPTRIPLPCRAEAISCGRRHLLVLDADNLIWDLRDWGRAYHHTAPSLTSPTNSGASTPGHVAQLSAGWSHSACLTSSGKLHVWYPFSEGYTSSLTPNEEMSGPLGAKGEDTSRTLRWGKVGDVVHTLEDIPSRPVCDGEDLYDEQEQELDHGEQKGARRTRKEVEDEWVAAAGRRSEERVVRIASGLDFLVALKENGEVWCHRVKEGEAAAWEYLPFFSGPSVSHITAQFEAITSYSPLTSRVYHRRLPSDLTQTAGFGAMLQPDNLPELQGKGVIQVALGDYHTAALTSKGEMWTWGQGRQGQLGLRGGEGGGEMGRVEVPTRVRFPGDSGESGGNAGVELSGEGDEKAGAAFVFSITAAGWHTGALMLGDPAQSVEEGGNAAETGGGEVESEVPLGQENTRDLLGMPDAFSTRGSAIFRVGFPGRGTGVGQIAQRAWRARAGTGQEGVGGNVDGEGDGDAESLGGAGPWAMNDRFH